MVKSNNQPLSIKCPQCDQYTLHKEYTREVCTACEYTKELTKSKLRSDPGDTLLQMGG